MAALLLLSLSLAVFAFDVPLTASAHPNRKLQNVGAVVNYGGKLLTSSPLDVYVIYYGSWPVNSGQTIIQTFIKSLGSNSGSQGAKGDATVKSWWETLSLYNQKNGGNVSKNVSEGKTVLMCHKCVSERDMNAQASSLRASDYHIVQEHCEWHIVGEQR